MPRVEVYIDDVEQMESLIRTGSSERRQGYDVSYSQLSRGDFNGAFIGTRWDVDRFSNLAPQAEIADSELPSGGALEYLSVQRYGPRLRIRGASPGDRTAFYIFGPETLLVRHRGVEVGPGSLVVVPPSSEMDFLVEGLEMTTFSLEQATVDSIWATAGNPPSADALPLSMSGTSLFEMATLMLSRDESRLGDRAYVRLFEETFASAVADAHPVTRRTRGAATRLGVRHVEAALHENLAQTIPSHILAQIAGLPLRTLQHAFQAELGVTPHRYHALLRMRAARRYLLAHNLDNGTVAEAATAHGFEHLGRFSVEYRRQFGESPSTTLSRGSSERAARWPASR